MHPKRKKHLITIIVFVGILAVAVGLMLYAIRSQTNYYFSPLQIANGEAEGKTFIKAGGMVVRGSVQRKEHLLVEFQVTDFKAVLPVRYQGILPDLFQEGSGVVGSGKIVNGVFEAEEILAKHDENYMPPEVAKSLKETHQNKGLTTP